MSTVGVLLFDDGPGSGSISMRTLYVLAPLQPLFVSGNGGGSSVILTRVSLGAKQLEDSNHQMIVVSGLHAS